MKFLCLVVIGLGVVSGNDGNKGLPGGHHDTEVDEKVLAAAKVAVSSLSGVTAVGTCSKIELVKVEKATKQVVAGTNYKLALRLATQGGSQCGDSVEKVCENIIVFEPLPQDCSGDNCLKLTNQEGIRCHTQFNSSPQHDLCSDKECGDVCDTSDGMLQVMRYCQPGGSCGSNAAPQCQGNDENKGLAGGHHNTEVDEKVLAAAKVAVSSLSGVTAVGTCSKIELVKVEKATKQIVAGTNYMLALRLATQGGSKCGDSVEKVCENIIVFEPLPHECSGDNCLKLTNQEGIKCHTQFNSAPQLGSQLKSENRPNSGGNSVVTSGFIMMTLSAILVAFNI